MPAPRIRAYSMESVVAEKIEAIVSLASGVPASAFAGAETGADEWV
jgi:hypothetical protein